MAEQAPQTKAVAAHYGSNVCVPSKILQSCGEGLILMYRGAPKTIPVKDDPLKLCRTGPSLDSLRSEPEAEASPKPSRSEPEIGEELSLSQDVCVLGSASADVPSVRGRERAWKLRVVELEARLYDAQETLKAKEEELFDEQVEKRISDVRVIELLKDLSQSSAKLCHAELEKSLAEARNAAYQDELVHVQNMLANSDMHMAPLELKKCQAEARTWAQNATCEQLVAFANGQDRADNAPRISDDVLTTEDTAVHPKSKRSSLPSSSLRPSGMRHSLPGPMGQISMPVLASRR